MIHGAAWGEILPTAESIRLALLTVLASVVAVAFLVALFERAYERLRSNECPDRACCKIRRRGDWKQGSAVAVGGFFLSVLLAILADHWAVYTVVVFLTGVLFVDEDFVLDLASALSGRTKVEIGYADPSDIRARQLMDLIESGELPATEERLQAHRNRHQSLLSKAIRTLVEENLFSRDDIKLEVALSRRDPQRRLVVDAVAETETDVLLIEVKSSESREALERGRNHLRRSIDLFNEFLSERDRSKRVRGLLVTPPTDRPWVDRDIFHLTTTQEEAPENISDFRRWFRV